MGYESPKLSSRQIGTCKDEIHQWTEFTMMFALAWRNLWLSAQRHHIENSAAHRRRRRADLL